MISMSYRTAVLDDDVCCFFLVFVGKVRRKAYKFAVRVTRIVHKNGGNPNWGATPVQLCFEADGS